MTIHRLRIFFLSLFVYLGLLNLFCSDKSDPTRPVPAPTVSITSPVAGDTISGAIQISATASNATIVKFYCSGSEIGTDDSSPFSVNWNSTTIGDGSHNLRVRAEGDGGSAEDQIQVTIHNGQTGVIVTVSPDTATVQVGQSKQFNALVTGTSNTAVTWSVLEGNSWGNISNTGLYTAPTVLPSPAVATVKATSVADPSKSATALVTLTGTGGISQEEIKLCQEIFNAGYDVADLGDETVNLAAEAVWGASELNGNNLTLTGTLTQTAQGSDIWTYNPNPTNKLIVIFAGGPTVEFTFSVFNGYLNGTWEDFTEQHTLNFTVFIQGQTNLQVQSQSGFVSANPKLISSPGYVPAWTREWQRVLTGTTLYEGEMLSLNVTHTGTEYGSIEPGWTELKYDENYSGTVNSPSSEIIISQYSYNSRIHNSNAGIHVLNGQLTNNSSATFNGVTYNFQSVHAAWAAGSSLNDPGAFNIVIDTNYWVAQGVMLKNGEHFGTVQFTGPVVANAYGGPDLILHLNTGEDIFLHTLVPWP